MEISQDVQQIDQCPAKKWAIWTNRNKVIFNKEEVKSANIIVLAINCLNDWDDTTLYTVLLSMTFM